MKRRIKWVKYLTRQHNLFEVLIANRGYTKGMKEEVGWGFKNVLFISRKGLESSYRGEKDESQFYNFIKKKARSDKNFIFRICKKIIDYSYKGVKTAEEIRKKKIGKISKKDLLRDFNSLYSIYKKFNSVYVFPMYVEKIFSERNKQIIKFYNKILLETLKESQHVYPIIEKAWKKLFGEIAKRAKINKRLITYASPGEIKDFLMFGKFFDKKELARKYEYYLLVTKIGKTKIYMGEKAMKVERQEIEISELPKKAKEIRGQRANKGKVVKGKVKIIFYKKDYSKIQNENIIVTPMTRPDYVPAIKKAVAVITDEGGITCHAAIISREINIPCIIGTKIATKVLKDGDLVEVDANKGVVKVLRKKS